MSLEGAPARALFVKNACRGAGGDPGLNRSAGVSLTEAIQALLYRREMLYFLPF